jgi:hypothetical protein
VTVGGDDRGDGLGQVLTGSRGDDALAGAREFRRVSANYGTALEIIGQQAERGMTSERGNCTEITSVERQHLHSFVSFRQ